MNINNKIENDDPVIYTVKDIQRIFKCGKNQAYELMNSDCFPSFKINCKLLVYKNKLEEFLNKNTGKTVHV